MSGKRNKKQPLPIEDEVAPKARATNKKEPVEVPTVVKVINRTNQKQVVAFKEDTYEFLAGEERTLALTPSEAEERFALYISKNILSIK